jgi:sortase A
MTMKVATTGAWRTLAVLAAAMSIPLTTALAATPDPSPGAGSLPENEVPAYPPVSSADPILGRIEIPRVGVSAPILQGVDDATIRRAVGHFPETPLPGQTGNVALAAHRTTDFYGLRNIRVGDEVTLTSARGEFRYRVERTWVVKPEDVSVLDPSSASELTLVTCYPFDYDGSAPERFIVRARAEEPPAPAPEEAVPAAAAAARTSN